MIVFLIACGANSCLFGQVEHPLDFSTIRKRQKKGLYAKLGFSKLWEDISTVYHNAQLYNQVRVGPLRGKGPLGKAPCTHRRSFSSE